MPSRAQQLCAAHGYPPELARLLERVVEHTRESLVDVRGIVLSPSVSTGDFLWKGQGEDLVFLSDIDGSVIADTPAATRTAFYQGLVDMARGLGGPHFKIDLSILPSRLLGHLPGNFQTVETGLAGFELDGEGLLERFPTGFDPRASRQAFLLNLWKPLATAEPGGCVQGMARLLMDIPLLATSELGICRPGHRARGEWFLTQRPEPLGASPVLRRAVEAAMAARVDPPGDERLLRELLVAAVQETIAGLDGHGAPRDDPDRALVRRFTRWLAPRTPRRIAGELRTLVRRPGPPIADLAWWMGRKEAMGGAGLWGLLQVAFGGRPPGPGTGRCLARYARRPAPDPGDPGYVTRAGELYQAGLLELYPSLEPASPPGGEDALRDL